MPEPGRDETVRVVALDKNFHMKCYKCEVSGPFCLAEVSRNLGKTKICQWVGRVVALPGFLSIYMCTYALEWERCSSEESEWSWDRTGEAPSL